MLTDHIASKLRLQFKDRPTPSQERLVEALVSFTFNNEDDALLIVRGYAGTGKTTAISAYVELLDEIKRKSVLLAPTGRAAKVLSSYSGRQAYTIHKKIYRQRSSKDGFGRFVLDNNLHIQTVFIVDEASMISNQKQDGSVFGSGCLLDDLLEYVYNGKGCKLLLVGDSAQLPPVGLDLSPALSRESIQRYSDTIAEAELREVMRQKKESGILHNANLVRNRIETGDYSMPVFKLNAFDDIVRVGGPDLIEVIANSYSKYGLTETVIVNRSNKRANQYNRGIRNSILGREEELVPGDLLMVVKNNYYWIMEEPEIDFIANGDIIEVLHIHKYQELYGYHYADCTVRLIDYDKEVELKIMLDVLYEETPALNNEKSREMFYTILEDYSNLKSRKKQFEGVRGNEYFNAIQVKYAYAVTCHKSQGGQWKSVFIDQGYIPKESLDKEYMRWLYTAITRATEKVYLVNFPDYFFE
jgi:exodeoxyribonuclease-5